MASRNESQISVFVKFCVASKRVSWSRTDNQKRTGAPAGQMDWPMLRYSWSLEHRITCVNYSFERVKDAEALAAEEIEEITRRGTGTYDPSLILVYNYESLVDQIYKAMENVAKVNLFLYDSKQAPPHDFQKQMRRIANAKLGFSKSYDRIMKEDMDWYKDVLRIRENSNHYAIGMGVFKRDDSGRPILQYLNYEISRREANCGNAGKIEINILDSAMELCTRFNSCMDAIGSAWLEEVDPTERCAIRFGYPDRIETRRVSLEEYRAGEHGELVVVTPFKGKEEN